MEAHPRGKQFSLITEVRVGDELVWEEVSTNLKRGGGSDDGAKAPGSELPRAEDLPATRHVDARRRPGRRYGSVSGDLNPIHVHPLTARLFGFKSAIAHGMWTKARCLGALQARLPDAFTVEVAFKKPIFLPGKVEFCELRGPARRSTSRSACATRARAARTWTAWPSRAEPPQHPVPAVDNRGQWPMRRPNGRSHIRTYASDRAAIRAPGRSCACWSWPRCWPATASATGLYPCAR